jgi:hypothetical protein
MRTRQGHYFYAVNCVTFAALMSCNAIMHTSETLRQLLFHSFIKLVDLNLK